MTTLHTEIREHLAEDYAAQRTMMLRMVSWLVEFEDDGLLDLCLTAIDILRRHKTATAEKLREEIFADLLPRTEGEDTIPRDVPKGIGVDVEPGMLCEVFGTDREVFCAVVEKLDEEWCYVKHTKTGRMYGVPWVDVLLLPAQRLRVRDTQLAYTGVMEEVSTAKGGGA